MSKRFGFRRVSALVLSAALGMSAVQPATAAPLPVMRDVGASSPVEVVQYRPGRRAYAPVRRNRGGNGGAAAAALAIGALAIGAAAIAASNQRRDRVYYDQYDPAYAEPQYYNAPGYYAPPAGYVYSPPRRDVAPDVYYGAPRYATPRHHRPAQIDGGSPYAVQQQRVQNREAWRRWQREQGY